MATLDQISAFLATKRLAIAGVSRNPNDFSRLLFREFLRRGYGAVPVHPGVGEIEGRTCFARVQGHRPAGRGCLADDLRLQHRWCAIARRPASSRYGCTARREPAPSTGKPWITANRAASMSLRANAL